MKKAEAYTNADDEVRELDKAFFANARRGRPPLPSARKKQQVTMLLDPDVLDHFKRSGKGWQTRINAALRQIAGL